jgi:microcystin-dependent protein
MNEVYLGEIRIFSWAWAPRYWMLCDGTLLQIRANQALFALLGTQYGGDGINTFALPDLRGRFPIGQGVSVRTGHVYKQGTGTNVENLSLQARHIPVHTHAATYQTSPSVPSSAFSVTVATNSSGQASPKNNLLGQSSAGCQTYAPVPGSPTTYLGGVVSSGGTYSAGNVTVQTTGGANIPLFPPYQVLAYMICTEGYFPSRP